MKPLQGTTQTLTRVIDTWQSTSEVNGQRPILQEFIKLGDQICELNYRETKSKIRDKLENQKYNFTNYQLIVTSQIQGYLIGRVRNVNTWTHEHESP